MEKFKQIAVLLCFVIYSSCSLLAQPVEITYLIPENYRGGVIIFFDQPDGITPEKTESGDYLYRIPADGFLKIKTPLEKKGYKLNYYFVDVQGNRTQLEYIYPTTYVRDPGDTTSRRHGEISGNERASRIFVESHETNSFNGRKGKVYFFSFVVGKLDENDKAFNDMRFRIDDIRESIEKEKDSRKNSVESNNSLIAN